MFKMKQKYVSIYNSVKLLLLLFFLSKASLVEEKRTKKYTAGRDIKETNVLCFLLLSKRFYCLLSVIAIIYRWKTKIFGG